MTPAEQLRAAKALIDDPDKWTRKAYARGKSGRAVSEFGKAAVCFCALGAAFRASANTALLADALPGKRRLVSTFNDDPATTHADIMKLFDDAIALAEAAQ